MRSGLETEVRAAMAKEFEEQASAQQAELLRQGRELGEREQRLELDFQRRLTEEAAHIREHEASAARER